MSTDTEASDTPDPPTALSQFLEELRREYLVWYAKSVRRCYIAYYALQVVAILTGFLSATIAAVTVNTRLEQARPWQVSLIVLPLVGGPAVTVLQTFRAYDRWQLGERGRLAFQDPLNDGRRALAGLSTHADASALHGHLIQRCGEIAHQQSELFFAATPHAPPSFGQAQPSIGRISAPE